MKILKQGYALSEQDLEMIDPKIITQMMKTRIVVEFDDNPDIDNLDFGGCTGFYHIKSLKSKLYQFWFENSKDSESFYSNILAYKMSMSSDYDDK
jgi:hypothetical protein|tara:strand:- start:1716 stop:2000 length:285 start_codon:yes stop_codon:yes gene_type:complete